MPDNLDNIDNMGINDAYEKVKEFHKIFGFPADEKPVFLKDDRIKKRSAWMLEEIQEFMESGNIYDQADAMIDLIYFALGTLVEMGVKPKEIFDIVQNANMSKLWSDGNVHHRESDGKVIKPPDWEDPYPKIKEEIDNQAK
ncbi:MAG: hypothetical protein FWD71_07585 [Oscillospiraceae bacterium]|nr:hypothetical protein [Oscillospiraceae bacterium]